MEKLKIEYVDINSIKPYEKNAKLHPKEQIEQIKKSIEQFGMDDPIGIWKDEIVEGHGRLIACKELGMTEVPIIRLDHLTDEERKAYTLAHNKLTMNSDFDIDMLNDELMNFDTIDMSDFGFDLGVFDSEEFGTEFTLQDGDREPIITMSITLSDEQAEKINEAISTMKQTDKFKKYENINKNSNGNALYLVVEEWLMSKI